jgi:CDP-glycerol glycerophosphotransferase
MLFYNGHFPPNGITASFLNLMENLCRSSDDQITVAIDPLRINAESSWREKFNLLPRQVKVQNRVGSVVYSPEEKWIGARFSSRHDLDSEEMRGLFRETYRREYRRVFGNARFDAVINFEGYNVLWSALLDQGAGGLRSVAYLHNDMVEEFQLKHMYLKSLFRLYHDYDKLVSVSERMCAVNRDKMSRMFGLNKEKFCACVNSIDVPTIIDNANAAVDGDLLHWFDAKYLFLTIGRMSPEKDHAKLINAFSRVHAVHPEARLMIVGDGPLRHVLNQQIIELGLERAICLAGQRENPFPLLRRCDCFVFPSNHEGQPMVLLEAMTLGKPIVATDIDGNRGVLEGDYGMLVENSAEGLENGMTAFIDGRVECKAFDATHYAQQAVAMFHNVVMGSRRNAKILRAAGKIST